MNMTGDDAMTAWGGCANEGRSRSEYDLAKCPTPNFLFKNERNLHATSKGIDNIERRYRSTGDPIDSIGQGNDWYQIPGGITIDSGAAESVMPVEMCQNYPVVEGMQKRMGVYYVAANGKEMDNEGERKNSFSTRHGGNRNMTFQVTEVTKALGSVSRLCSRSASGLQSD